MNSDMGQAWILPGNDATFTVRVIDINGKLYNNKSYEFAFPSSCPND